MDDKTIVEKAAEKVGYGLAMAEDVAGSVKTAVGAAVTTVAHALQPATKAPNQQVPETSARKVPAKKAAKKSPLRKSAAKKAARKSVKKHAKKARGAKR
jgi:hypothetical protein